MKRNRILPIVISLVLITAGILMANSNWNGTFTGDRTGVWSGTIYDSQEPAYYEGEWKTTDQEPADTGTWYGDAELIGRYYVIERGIIYDEDGEPMGRWSGRFPAYDDAQALGRWAWETGEDGDFIGSQP